MLLRSIPDRTSRSTGARRRWGRALAVAVVASGGILLAACSGGGTGGTGGAAQSSAVLTVAPNATGPFTRVFNPYLPTATSASGFADNLIYEPLMMPNYYKDTDQPWLATAMTWSNAGRTLTITVRSGVKWSDGQPFSASDVAYTFDLFKKYPALNNGGYPVTSATAPSATTAVINFSEPSYTYMDGLALTKPVPAHIWKTVHNPATYADSDPVGTGPYVLSNFTPQAMTFTKNPKFWQASGIHVPTVIFDSFDSASSIETAMESGQITWEDHVFTGYNQLFSRPGISGQNASTGVADLVPNTSVYPLNLQPVRQAISVAIDRSALTTTEDSGQQPATSPTGLMGGLAPYIAPAYQSLHYSAGNPAAAQALLQNAGFKMGSNGIFITPKGTPLQLTMLLGSGQGNLITLAQAMQQELKKAGIGLQIKTEIISAVTADVAMGSFQLNINSDVNHFSPFGFYGIFNPQYYAPDGKRASSDQSRFNDPAVKALFTTLAQSAPGSAAASQAIAGLEKVMVDQMPVIPLNSSASQWAFNTTQFTGWPTKANPYAFAEVLEPNAELVMLHLRAK
ncbi:MAG TPA: ABC transporter substrate-binding protein [Trebonia sp.]|jgi:peptide/nickel transport system substrate-binding protein|nr:ABC transporter substrate-binding protein [Trebonia sp.]